MAEAPASARHGRLQVLYYTDPLCVWSWAFEPQWRRLQMEYADVLRVERRMGGLIADWKSFADSLNDVSRPVQMGPLWFQARTISGMPSAERIWYEDPPASSYPACLAVKAASLQGEYAGELMLRRLREAVMLEQRNIAHRAILLEVAAEMAADNAGHFDTAAFAAALDDSAALDALRSDLNAVRDQQIGRFPTLLLRNCESGQAVALTGYRPYTALRDVMARLAPAWTPPPVSVDAATYLHRWRRTTARELAEVLTPEDVTPHSIQPTLDTALKMLDTLVDEGRAERCGHIYTWRSPMQP